ncbi:MAG: hypothetical protein EA390_08695, partial [Balneolaceae bacterium]
YWRICPEGIPWGTALDFVRKNSFVQLFPKLPTLTEARKSTGNAVSEGIPTGQVFTKLTDQG